MTLAYLPSPTRSAIHLGPIPLRAYALFIVIGIVVACWLGERRWVARGGRSGVIGDIAVWAVPFGLIGGRLYNVITDYELYFGAGKDPWDAFKVWDGGLGIWGAIALGGVGALIGARRAGLPLPALADAIAPGIVLAQAVGRWGNYFNNELYGRPTTMPWGLTIHAIDLSSGRAYGPPLPGHYQPTFLYESLWCVGVAILVIWADRRFTLGHGRAFALYVAAYTVGRGWIEYLRIDNAHHILGLRLNDWTAIVVFCGAVTYIVLSARLRPGRESPAVLGGTAAGPVADADATVQPDAADGDVGVTPVVPAASHDSGPAGAAESGGPAAEEPAAEPEPSAAAVADGRPAEPAVGENGEHESAPTAAVTDRP